MLGDDIVDKYGRREREYLWYGSAMLSAVAGGLRTKFIKPVLMDVLLHVRDGDATVDVAA